MDIIVNDTNIFIDLFTSGLLDEFHCLPIEVHTVDFVINELTDDEQRNAVEFFVNSNHLKVHNLSGEEILDVANFQASLTGNLSFTDCAVCHYAKKNDYTLLTGDAQLRKQAIKSNVKVKGIIYVFDILVEHQVITPQLAAERISLLYKINQRLPKKEIEERIVRWSKI